MREEADGTTPLWCGLEEREEALSTLASSVAVFRSQIAAALLTPGRAASPP